MRRNGIIMHISSLPSPYGIGKLGKNAYAFVDFLVDSGVQAWQILPLAPTSYGDSPYQSFSVFAGNPYFIDFEELEEKGYLNRTEYTSYEWGADPRRVDYARVYTYTFDVLRRAFGRFDQKNAAFQQFCTDQASWLNDYALFMALKDHFDGKPWYLWTPELVRRDPVAIETAKKEYADDIAFYQVMQFWFFRQWKHLKNYCKQRKISIIGDIPIYVAHDSADVWAHPELFQFNEDGQLKAVAGCPPDDFSPTGQLWGNPLYDWNYHEKTGYRWWISRLAAAAELYDIIRIDHFRGFESYYAIPYGKETAEIGLWQPGPGMKLFRALAEELGELSIIAEDLGFMTPEVQKLLADTGYPGMKVLQFAFDGDPQNTYLPQNFTTTHCVAYTGTHDNETLRGWVQTASTTSLNFAKRYLHCRSLADLPSEIIRATWSSVAELAMAQMQDFLESGADGRMNTPATLGNNWQFRTVNSDFNSRLVKRIHRINELYNRLPADSPHAKRTRSNTSARARTTEQHTKKVDTMIPNTTTVPTTDPPHDWVREDEPSTMIPDTTSKRSPIAVIESARPRSSETAEAIEALLKEEKI